VSEPTEDELRGLGEGPERAHGVMDLLRQLHPARFFLDTWRQVDERAISERAKSTAYDFRPFAALAVGAVSLIAIEYLGSSKHLFSILNRLAESDNAALTNLVIAMEDSRFYRLFQFIWWSAWRVLCYFVVPSLLIRTGFRARLRDYGLGLRGAGPHLWIWGICYLPMLAVIIIASSRGDFIRYYPFYEQAQRSWFDLAIWELLYAAQFFALEFFFRGFWLNACKSAMGSQAIFAMVVPYCMIHFGKPWPETAGAIFAGVFLGTLAFRSGSIWIGFLIHESVALSMDVIALYQTGSIPTVWWPN
jgi:membrane protease YdiL (CAAX protease family)